MAYGERKDTLKKIEHLLQIPEEELAPMRDILNKYISKNRKKHKFILRKALARRLGSMINDELVDDILQTIYIYSWQNIERVMEFYKTDSMDRYFNSLFYHIATTKRARLLLGRDIHTEIIDDILEAVEDDRQYTNDALNPKLTIEERIEAHRIALDETKEYLYDNPQSKLNKALEIQKKYSGQKGYDVAINYVTTPSYTFLMKNYKELNIHNVQANINKFKEVCEEVYGKQKVKQCEIPYTKWN